MSDSTATGGPAAGAAGDGSGSSVPSRRSSRQVGERRGNPLRRLLTFYRQVVAELRKVIWPTRRELVTYTAVVLVFVLFMVAIVSVYDFGASQGVLAVFGDG